MDFGTIFAIILGITIIVVATVINREINRSTKNRPVETIEETIEEEQQTTFSKEELAEAIEKGITEAKKKEQSRNANGGCLVFIIIAILSYFLVNFLFDIDAIVDWINTIPTD